MDNVIYFIAGAVLGGSFALMIFCCLQVAGNEKSDPADRITRNKR